MSTLARRWEAARYAWRQYRTMYLFMLPFIVLFLIFVVAPVLTAAYLSFV